MQKRLKPAKGRRPLSEIRAELQAARLACDVAQMEQLLIEGSRGRRNRQEFLLHLGRLYEEQSCRREAVETWRASFDEEPSLEAAYQLLRHRAVFSGWAIRNRIETLFSPAALAAVEDLLRRGPTPPRAVLRHIGICGTSYSGSTLLGRLICSADGFRDIGESHWLIDQKELSNGKRQIDFFTSPPSPTRRYCRQCGERCQVLSTDFRVELQLHRSNWYARIAERLGTSQLVSSDKNSAKYVALDPKLRFDAVVLFKSPAAAWHSVHKRLRATDPAEVDVKLEEFMAKWIREYENALRMVPSGQKLFLQFDTIVRDPSQTIGRILEAAGLPKCKLDFDAAMKGHHTIGGNDDFITASSKTKRIDVSPLVDDTLQEEHRRRIAANGRMMALFDGLSSRSRAMFGAP